MITVHHNILFLEYQFEQPDQIPRLLLEIVATVDTGTNKSDDEELNKAFELTNHIETDWTRNEEVTAFKKHPRSTSVGDILEIWEPNTEEHKYFFVSSCGFKKVTLMEKAEWEEMFKDPSTERYILHNYMHDDIARLKSFMKEEFHKYFVIQ